MSDNVAQNDRDAVIQVLSRQPADASLDHIRHEFETIFGILEGARDARDERFFTHEEVMAQMRVIREGRKADEPSVVAVPRS
jgi:predicted transcriptional regulator